MANVNRTIFHRIKTSQIFLALNTARGLVFVVCLTMVVQSLLIIAQPWPIREIIDHVVPFSHPAGKNAEVGLLDFIFSSVTKAFHSEEFSFIYRWIGVLLAIYMGSALFRYVQNITLARLGQKVVQRIRRNVFSQMIALPHGFFEKAETGDLTSRVSKDTADAEDILESSITIFVRSVPTILGILIISFTLDWVYALTFLFVIPLVYWANVTFNSRTKNEMRSQRRLEGRLASNVQEAFYYHKAIATLSIEESVVDDIAEYSRKSAVHGVRAGKFQGFLNASLDLLVGCTSILVLLVGVLRIMHGCLTVGQLMVFLSYLNSLFKPIREISKFSGRIAKSLAAVERVEEIVRLNPTELGAAEYPDAKEAPEFKGAIEFKGVTFGYEPGRSVLKNFNLSIRAGQKVVLVGESGSGKTTVLQLLMRLYDPDEGEILIDGIDIRTLTLASLRRQMAVVLQDSFIFNTSLAENIAVAKPGASHKDLKKAAQAARADQFIKEFPEGYNTKAGENGAILSGGQKRRIAIARAFLRDAPILILDEPTTGLDAISEQQVTQALKELGKERTTVAITHQLSTAANADLIVVLANGRMLESGSPDQLRRQDGAYQQLWETQMTATSR